MKDVSLRQWRSFVAVAKHLSFARAAEELFLTPSALTQQIKEMEESIGLPVFDRTNRSVSLTVTGEYLVVYGRRILGVVREAENVVAKLRRLETGRVVVGAVNTAKYFVPALMMAFRKRHPDIELRIVIEQRKALLTLLDEGDIDIAVMGRPPKEYAVRSEPFATNPHAFIAAPGLLNRRQLEPAMLASIPLVIRERGAGTRALFDRYMDDIGVTPRIALEAKSNETLKQAAIAGMGVAFLSLHAVGAEIPAGTLEMVAVDGTPLVRQWNCVYLQGRTLSPIAEAFRYFLLEQGAQVLDVKYADLKAKLAPEFAMVPP